jgi:hypothetical protein
MVKRNSISLLFCHTSYSMQGEMGVHEKFYFETRKEEITWTNI